MNNYENEYRDSENENYEYNTEMESGYEFENFEQEDEYNNEFEEEEEELSSEFENESEDEYEGEYEGEDEYQQEEEFQNEDEYEDEFQNEDESEYEDEYEYENEEEAEYEAANEYESPKRPPQRNTFSPGVKSFYPPKSRTRPSWAPVKVPTRSPYKRYRPNSPYNQATPWYMRSRKYAGIARPHRHHRRHPHRYWRNRYGNYPYNPALQGNNMQTQTPPPPFQDMGSGGAQQPSPNMSGGGVPQQQDGNFQTYILDTLKSLSAQIAASNESIASLKNSLPNSPQQPGGGMDTPAPVTTTPPKEETPQNKEYEMENYEYNMEYEGEVTDREGSFNEMTEMELASELLNINNEMELNYFLGSLVKKAVGAVTGILKTPQGKMLASALKNVARKALKPAGAAIGTAIGGPLGTQIGASVGDAASKMFELEMEGLSHEDREFEVARSVVRFSGNAVKQLTEQDSGDPQEDARQALIQASILYAPGLIIRRGNRYRPNNRGGRRRY